MLGLIITAVSAALFVLLASFAAIAPGEASAAGDEVATQPISGQLMP